MADCSTVLAGPYCTMLLGDLGANVVKVEPPEGDATRGWGPPWVAPGIGGPDDPGTAAYFLAANRNKRSIRLDLRAEAGRDVLRRLLARSDVVVENFRVGGFARLGFDDAALEALNPRLVHLAISGYGPTGPRRLPRLRLHRPGGLRAHVDHRCSRRRRRPAHQDRRRRQRPDDRHARRSSPSSRRSPAAIGPDRRRPVVASGSTSPCSGRRSRGSRTRPRTTSSRARHRRAAATRTRTSSRTKRSRQPTDGSRWPWAASASGRASARHSVRHGSRMIRGSRPTGRASRTGSRSAPMSRPSSAAATSASWLGRLAAHDVPAGPINDLAAAFAAPQVAALGSLVELEHPVLGPRPPGRAAVRAGSDARHDSHAAAASRRALGRDPRRARVRARRDRPAASLRHVLIPRPSWAAEGRASRSADRRVRSPPSAPEDRA